MKYLIIFVYVTLLVVMGLATFAEAAVGTWHVHADIYGANWFATLWGVLAVLGTIKIVKDFKVFKCPKDLKEVRSSKSLAVLLLHLSFLIILAGALITHLTGRSGTIHLRMGEQQTVARIEHCGKIYYHRLNFAVELTDFQIIEDEAGNIIDYRSEFSVLGDSIAEPLTVSMNRIARYGAMRFYQYRYDNDLRGSTLMINRDPYGIPITYCGYALLFASFIWLVVCRNRQSRLPRESSRIFKNLQEFSKGKAIVLSTLLLTALWCLYYFVLDGSWAQIPVLRHPLLIFHVVIIILAYALLLIQTVISVAFLFRNLRSLRNLRIPRQPASPTNTLLLPALCLLSIGIFLGAIWANISWGEYWSWDSKEVWALITLMIYAAPLHRRSLPVFNRPVVFHIYTLLAFLCVLMTYFGVNYYLTGMHSYN